MKKRKNIPAGIIGFIMLCGSGYILVSCATKPVEYESVDDAVNTDDFRVGVEEIRSGQERKKPRYSRNNSVSLFMDKGLMEHYGENYAASSQDLQEAERLIEEAYTKSVTADIASYIVNDNVKEYPGEDFEDIYISVFNALNYYNQGNIEGALVEIRKLTLSNGKLDMLGRKFEKTDNTTFQDAITQIAKLGFTNFPALPEKKPVNFSDSALARYLGALFYLGDGNTDSARIEFERIREAFAANPNIYHNPFPNSAADAQNVPNGKARLNIIGFAGLSPIKKEQIFNQIFPFFMNKVLWYPQFKLPALAKRPSRIDRIEVIVGDEKFDLELLEDMGAVIEETYNARFSSMFLKTYIRTMLKYALVDIAATEAANRLGGSELVANASALAGKKAFDATERADVRMSRYLPGKAYIGGINLDPGTYTVTVHFCSGSDIVAKKEYENVVVRANALNLMETVSLK